MIEGKVNNPKYVGITKRVPNMYQGVLFPHRVFILSLAIPTKGLMIPSAIYPDKKAWPARSSGTLTTDFKYQVR